MDTGPKTDRLKEILDVFRQAKSVAMCGHTRPDGDCIGSQLGLRPLLRSFGTEVFLLSPDPVPPRYGFLEGIEDFRQDPPNGSVDAVVLLDCGSVDRAGPLKEYLTRHDVLINLDHHPQDNPTGTHHYVDPTLSCVGELVYYLYEANGTELPVEACEPLYVSLLTDTGGFRHSNTGSASHRIASLLLERGQFNPHEVYKNLYERETLRATKLLGIILQRARSRDGLVWSQVRLEDLRTVGVESDDVNGAVELLRRIDTCEVALLFWEQSDGTVKINFRSKHGFDLLTTVRELGGGGHDQAAGATVEGDLSAVRDRVLKLFHQRLRKHRGQNS